MKETRAFNRLWEHSNTMQSLQRELRCRKTGESRVETGLQYAALHDHDLERRMQAEVSALTNITEETNLLKEIKDVIDELSSMLIIYKDQGLVVKSMGNEDGDESDDKEDCLRYSPSDTVRLRKRKQTRKSHARLMRSIESHKSDLETLMAEATRTHDAVSSTIQYLDGCSTDNRS